MIFKIDEYSYTTEDLRITPSNKAIMAITNNTCIRPPAEYINTPNAQPMMRITAMIYNSDLMVDYVLVKKMFFYYNNNQMSKNVLSIFRYVWVQIIFTLVLQAYKKIKVPKALAAGDFQPKPYHNRVEKTSTLDRWLI
jgi:hypothetical protein